MIDLRLAQLRSFVAVAETLHFGRAAERLSLGQPAVSQHVRRLEREVGAELLTRTSRTVRLTVAGERFRDAADAALRELERGVAEARAVATGELGTLRVAAQQSARASLVPRLLATLARDAPGLTLDVLSATTAEALDAVARGDAEVALVRGVVGAGFPEGIVTERLATDPVMAVLPVGHPLAGRATLGLWELAGQPRVGWAREGAPDYHDRIAAVLRAAGVEERPALALRGVDTRLGAVAHGLGWAMESAAYRWMLSGQVCFVAIEGEPLRGEIVAAWPAVHPAPGLSAFLAAARSAAAQRSTAASASGVVTGAWQTKPSHT